MKNLLNQITQLDNADTFDADHFAEWFIEGSLSDADIATLTGEQMDAVAENIQIRWGDVDVQAWDDKALHLLKV